jgi:hypothetical protein
MDSVDIFSAAQGPWEEESFPGQTWRHWKKVSVQWWHSPYESDDSVEKPTTETMNNNDNDDDDNNNDYNNDDDNDHNNDNTNNTNNFASEAKSC